MSHPFESYKAHDVSKSRVSKITHGAASATPKIHRASGGKVHPDAAQDKKLIKKMIGAAEGPAAARRADRVERKKGGRVKPASVNINVISAPSAAPPGVAGGLPPGGMPPMPPGPPMGGPPPGLPPKPPMGPPPGGPPSGLPPMMARARGGSVKSGPAWEEGLKEGTHVQHDPGKNQALLKPSPKPKRASGGKVDLSDVKRPDQNQGQGPTPDNLRTKQWDDATKTKRASGGKVGKLNAPQGVAPATKLPGGAGGGLGRLAKASKYGGK